MHQADLKMCQSYELLREPNGHSIISWRPKIRWQWSFFCFKNKMPIYLQHCKLQCIKQIWKCVKATNCYVSLMATLSFPGGQRFVGNGRSFASKIKCQFICNTANCNVTSRSENVSKLRTVTWAISINTFSLRHMAVMVKLNILPNYYYTAKTN